MKRILFVDDEPFILEAMQALLSDMGAQWEMHFLGSGSEALQKMAKKPADVVVSDMLMPGMTGAELLNEIMERHPRTIRFILSGYADMDLVMQCVGGTHQFLAKPCSGKILCETISRALAMEERVNNEQIRALVSQLKTVPSLPSLYFDILKVLRTPDAPLDNIGELISRDPAMTVKILHVVNSVFFGLGRQLSDPREAVFQLGLETIKSLVLGLHMFSQCEPTRGVKMHVEKLYHHSMATATMARRIAQLARQPANLGHECFTAGLLHDIGRLVLAANLPGQFAAAATKALQDGVNLLVAEQEVFGVNHAEVSGYLLNLWGLPMPMVEAGALHHNPTAGSSREFTALTAVHVADVLVHERDEAPPQALPQFDEAYLTEVGVWEKVPEWRDKLADAQEAMASSR